MSGCCARTATAEELFERRVPPLYHLTAVTPVTSRTAMAGRTPNEYTHFAGVSGTADADVLRRAVIPRVAVQPVHPVILAEYVLPMIVPTAALMVVDGDGGHLEYPGLSEPEVTS